MQFGDTLELYCSFLKDHEVKNQKCENHKLIKEEQKKIRHPFLCIPDISKCGHKTCDGCGNIMYECHDAMIGLFCVKEVIKHYTNCPWLVCNVVVKKIFLDCYNQVLKWESFKDRKGEQDEYVFPPLCVQDNTFSYALFFYKWIIEYKWRLKDSSDEEADY